MPMVFAPEQIAQLQAQGYCTPLRIFGSHDMTHYRQRLKSTELSDNKLAVHIESQPHLRQMYAGSTRTPPGLR